MSAVNTIPTGVSGPRVGYESVPTAIMDVYLTRSQPPIGRRPNPHRPFGGEGLHPPWWEIGVAPTPFQDPFCSLLLNFCSSACAPSTFALYSTFALPIVLPIHLLFSSHICFPPTPTLPTLFIVWDSGEDSPNSGSTFRTFCEREWIRPHFPLYSSPFALPIVLHPLVLSIHLLFSSHTCFPPTPTLPLFSLCEILVRIHPILVPLLGHFVSGSGFIHILLSTPHLLLSIHALLFAHLLSTHSYSSSLFIVWDPCVDSHNSGSTFRTFWSRVGVQWRTWRSPLNAQRILNQKVQVWPHLLSLHFGSTQIYITWISTWFCIVNCCKTSSSESSLS